jgi:hypothetical protein
MEKRVEQFERLTMANAGAEGVNKETNSVHQGTVRLVNKPANNQIRAKIHATAA